MDSTHPELEALVAAQPEDVGPSLVYADWLQQRGDPRGEFIALQCAAEREQDAERQRAIEARTVDVRVAVETALRNQLHALDVMVYEVRWRRGFVDFINLKPLQTHHSRSLEQLSVLPCLRFLRELEYRPDEAISGVQLLARTMRSETLEYLSIVGGSGYARLGDVRTAPLSGQSPVRFDSFVRVSPLAAAFRRLRSLNLNCDAIRFDDQQWPEIRGMKIRAGHVKVPNGTPPLWPSLRSLALDPRRGSSTDLPFLLRTPAELFPMLEALELTSPELRTTMWLLERSLLLKQLKRLDFVGDITRIRTALAERVDRLQHLERLTLPGPRDAATDQLHRELGDRLVVDENPILD